MAAGTVTDADPGSATGFVEINFRIVAAAGRPSEKEDV